MGGKVIGDQIAGGDGSGRESEVVKPEKIDPPPPPEKNLFNADDKKRQKKENGNFGKVKQRLNDEISQARNISQLEQKRSRQQAERAVFANQKNEIRNQKNKREKRKL